VDDKKTPPVTNPARITADNSADDTAEKYGELAERAAERIATRRPPPGRYQLTGPASLRTGLGIIHHENAGSSLSENIRGMRCRSCGAHLQRSAGSYPSGKRRETGRSPTAAEERATRKHQAIAAGLGRNLSQGVAVPASKPGNARRVDCRTQKERANWKNKIRQKTFCFRVKANTGLSRAPRRKTRGGQKQETQNP
jgi:hypothetical protein